MSAGGSALTWFKMKRSTKRNTPSPLADPHCPRRLNICMVSDFFYPNLGGIESHVYQLSYCLRKRGHRVVVVTHMYGSRVGVRYITGGIKVYYLPIPPFPDQVIFPTMGLSTLPFLRYVFLRHSVDIVHGHSAFSPLAQDALFHARLLGIHTVFTDHSLFGFADVSSIFINHQLCRTLASADHVICVSHMAKENTVLRAKVQDPWAVSASPSGGGYESVSTVLPLSNFWPSSTKYDTVRRAPVIPNAVDATKYLPKPSDCYAGGQGEGRQLHRTVNVVTMSRLVYRRGIDLLVEIIPRICAKYPMVTFTIGGVGPKRISLEEMREKYRLQDRVALLGRVDLDNVPKFLRQGSIYINTSLTEAFCISIIEAACVGLLVVSTKVGGIPEVLPPDMMRLAQPDPDSLQACLEAAIEDVVRNHASLLDPQECHERIKAMYSWDNVAARTETAYARALKKSVPSLLDTITVQYRHCGFLINVVMMLMVVVQFVELWICRVFMPVEKVWNKDRSSSHCEHAFFSGPSEMAHGTGSGSNGTENRLNFWF